VGEEMVLLYKKNKGFTLVELLCALCLLGIMTAIVLPSFSNPLDSVKLKSDARQLAWVLRSSRQDAINTGVGKTVKFYTRDTKNQMYTVVGGKTYRLTQGIYFDGHTNFPIGYDKYTRNCICYPSGKCSGGTATLSNGRDNLYVIVNPISGRVRISRDLPEK